MACSTRPGPAAFVQFIDDISGYRLTQQDWHDLRKKAEEAGYAVSRRPVDPAENTARIDAIAADLKMQDADDADDVRAALADVQNTEATLAIMDYLAANGVESTLANLYFERGDDAPGSRYEWEEGTIMLPSAAVAPMKKALREAANKFQAETLAAARGLVKGSGTKNAKEFKKWLNERQNTRFRRNPSGDFSGVTVAERTAENFLMQRLGGQPWDETVSSPRVTVPTAAELEQFGVRKMTNRNDEFEVISGDGYSVATIRFNEREVTWSVGENNHAVEEAHAAPMAKVFFAELGKVKWTRGTGGVFAGNDEYNEDSRESGGGANYTTMRFGPAGDEDEIREIMRFGFSRKKAVERLKARREEAALRARRRW